MWVIAIGNVFDGIFLIGPFKTFDEAHDHAETLDCPWDITKLEKPE